MGKSRHEAKNEAPCPDPERWVGQLRGQHLAVGHKRKQDGADEAAQEWQHPVETVRELRYALQEPAEDAHEEHDQNTGRGGENDL